MCSSTAVDSRNLKNTSKSLSLCKRTEHWHIFYISPGPEVIKLFPCSTQLSMKFFPLINVKMPTIVGILTFMSRKNSILGLYDPEKCWTSRCFYTYEHLKFHALLSWAWKKFYNLGPRSQLLLSRTTIISRQIYWNQKLYCCEISVVWDKLRLWDIESWLYK